MLRYGFLVLAIASAAPARAEQWWLVSHGNDFAGFIDRDSIERRGEEAKASLWRINYREGEAGEKSHRLRARWNCAANTMRVTSASTYDAYGDELPRLRAPRANQEPEYVGRGTIGRAELDFVCENRSKAARLAAPAQLPPVESVDKAVRIRRLGFSLTDSFALALADPASPGYGETFQRIVPLWKREAVARIVGYDVKSGDRD